VIALRTKEAERCRVQGRYHFHPEWAGYMGKSYKAPTLPRQRVTMRKPETSDHLCLGVQYARHHNIDTTVVNSRSSNCATVAARIVQDVVIPTP